ncbi:F0F1 ATP synthase subunit B [Candidatus Nomurabacteria bacterium]|nr:F0F1 ATP synthase subunit B [Candidatus Nomurabacteria bacterium]
MDSFIETFHIDWKIIIAQSVNFIVVLFILYFLLVKPLKKMMAERTETITGGLNDAKVNKELLLKTQKEYDDVLANARIEANTIFQEGKKEALETKRTMVEKAGEEVEQMIANGKKVLESEKAKMIEEAKNEIVSLVVSATEKLLESHKDENFDKKTMEKIKKM